MKRTTFQPCERLVDGKLASYLRPRFSPRNHSACNNDEYCIRSRLLGRLTEPGG